MKPFLLGPAWTKFKPGSVQSLLRSSQQQAVESENDQNEVVSRNETEGAL